MLLQNALNETGNSHHNGTAQHQANIIQHIQRIRYIICIVGERRDQNYQLKIYCKLTDYKNEKKKNEMKEKYGHILLTICWMVYLFSFPNIQLVTFAFFAFSYTTS